MADSSAVAAAQAEAEQDLYAAARELGVRLGVSPPADPAVKLVDPSKRRLDETRRLADFARRAVGKVEDNLAGQIADRVAKRLGALPVSEEAAPELEKIREENDRLRAENAELLLADPGANPRLFADVQLADVINDADLLKLCEAAKLVTLADVVQADARPADDKGRRGLEQLDGVGDANAQGLRLLVYTTAGLLGEGDDEEATAGSAKPGERPRPQKKTGKNGQT